MLSSSLRTFFTVWDWESIIFHMPRATLQAQSTLSAGLLPLSFHMSDQTHSVAKVQISKLSSNTGKGVLIPQGWPGHQGQGLLAVRVEEYVPPQGPTALSH